MFAAGVKRKLQARHFLTGDFGDETVPHSHPYDVEAVGYTDKLDENGFSINIALLEEILEQTLAKIDDRLLNDLPYFKGKQPSLENLCLYLRNELIAGMAESGNGLPEELEIRIWESDTAWASTRDRVNKARRG